MVDKGVHLFGFAGVDHHPGPLVRQKDVFVLIEDIQLRLEQGEEQVVLPGLLKKFVVDIDLEHVALRQPLVPLAPRTVALHPLDAYVLLQQRAGQQGHGFG